MGLYDDIISNNTLSREQKAEAIKQRGAEELAQIEAEKRKNMRDIWTKGAAGAALMGASMLPVFNVPYVGTGIGGAMFSAGDSIAKGEKLKDITKNAGTGFLIGETVGAVPYVGKLASKTKTGQAVAKQTSNLFQKIAEKPIVQKAEDVLMTDIKAFNPNKQTAFHGSPADFNKFSNDAIGTGEGVQAHGMGHYTALDKNIADNRYRKRLLRTVEEREVDSKYKPLFDEEQKIFDAKSRELYNLRFKDNKLSEEEYQKGIDEASKKTYEILDEWHNAINNIDKTKATKETGQLYKLSVPKDDVMLREGASFAEQPKFVQDAIEKELKKQIGTFNYSGEELERLRNLIIHNNPENLGQYGVKGISYNGGIDGEARVIFNPDDIDIVRKYYNQPNLWQYITGKNNIGTDANILYNSIRQ